MFLLVVRKARLLKTSRHKAALLIMIVMGTESAIIIMEDVNLRKGMEVQMPEACRIPIRGIPVGDRILVVEINLIMTRRSSVLPMRRESVMMGMCIGGTAAGDWKV